VSQICPYIDDDVQETARIGAKEKGPCQSSYVNEILKKSNEDRPPNELLMSLGSWEDDLMEVPEELPWSLDMKRKTL